MNYIKIMKGCGNAGFKQCKNVIFEVMNEARFNKEWPTSTKLKNGTFNTTQFRNWHNEVALWVRNHGGYLVAANVKPAAGEHACSSNNDDVSCILEKCTATTCPAYNSTTPNFFTPFLSSNISIVSLHAGNWLEGSDAGNICKKAQDPTNQNKGALIFKKPVIFDDDGDNSTLSDKAVAGLQSWALQVSALGTSPSCTAINMNLAKGRLNLYHTKDGTKLEGNQPLHCNYADTPKVDCYGLNALADGIAEKFCGGTGQTACDGRKTYCEQGPLSGCNPIADPP